MRQQPPIDRRSVVVDSVCDSLRTEMTAKAAPNAPASGMNALTFSNPSTPGRMPTKTPMKPTITAPMRRSPTDSFKNHIERIATMNT